MEPKTRYPQSEFERDIDLLAKRIQARGKKFTGIYGIIRGGWVPAVWLSHRLNLPIVKTESEINPGTIVVDDIVDSGRTIKKLFERLGFFPFVCALYKGRQCDVEVNEFARMKENSFIVFPWETEKSARYDET